MSCSTLPGGDPQPRDYPLATLDSIHRRPALAAQLDVGPVQFVPRQRTTFDAGPTQEMALVDPTRQIAVAPEPRRQDRPRATWLVLLVVAVVGSGMLGGWLAVRTLTPSASAPATTAEAVALAEPQQAAIADEPVDTGPREAATLAASDDAAQAIAEAVGNRTLLVAADEAPTVGLARAADAMHDMTRPKTSATPSKADVARKVSAGHKAEPQPEPRRERRRDRAERSRPEPSPQPASKGLVATAEAEPTEAPTLEDAFGGLTTGTEAAERRKLAERRERAQPEPAEDTVEALSRSEVAAAVRGVYGKVRACEASADVSGKLVIKFDVLGSGRVRNARVASREFFDSKVGACVATAVEGMSLRATGATASRTITYPFHIAAR